MAVQYYALVMNDRTVDDPHELFRYRGSPNVIEVWAADGSGWKPQWRFMRFIREETGPSKSAKNRQIR